MKRFYEAIESQDEDELFTMIGIICFISKDRVYISCIQRHNIKTPTWFHERAARNLSLGGMLVLLILKTLQTNIQGFQSISLHSVCIATLVNMAPAIVEMEAVVCQKLVVVLDQSSKRFFKSESEEWKHIHSDIIAMVLEICNSIISESLKTNSNLVYSLLQYPNLNDLLPYQRFHTLATNLQIVVWIN
jgi:dymeclin